MCIFGRALNRCTATAVPALCGAVFKVRFIFVIELNGGLFPSYQYIIDVIALIGIGTWQFYIENHAGCTVWNGVGTGKSNPFSGICLFIGDVVVVIGSAAVGVNHFQGELLGTTAGKHRTCLEFIRFSSGKNAGHGAAGGSPAGSSVMHVERFCTAMRFVAGNGDGRTNALPAAVSGFKCILHQVHCFSRRFEGRQAQCTAC